MERTVRYESMNVINIVIRALLLGSIGAAGFSVAVIVDREGGPCTQSHSTAPIAAALSSPLCYA